MTTVARRTVVAAAWLAILAVAAWTGWRVAQGDRAPPTGPDVRAVQSLRGLLGFGARPDAALSRREFAGRRGGDLYHAVYLAETVGPAAAEARLRERRDLRAAPGAGGEEGEDARIGAARGVLLRLYDGPPEELAARAGALSDEDRGVLAEAMGWAGRVAAAPPGTDEAERTRLFDASRRGLIAVAVAAGLACVVGVVGVIAAVVVFAVLRRPLPRPRYVPGSGAEPAFVAAAAAFFVAFAAVGGARAWRPDMFPQVGVVPAVVTLAITFGAVVLAGRLSPPPAEARRRIGWTLGAGALREVGAAIAFVPVLLGFLVVGIGLTLALSAVLGADLGSAAHPVAQLASRASAAELAGILFLAAVVAPFAEETVFRGLLYHHLRSATAGWGRAASVAACALGQALLFAAIHPQGALGLPALGSIAVALALLREMRGSLVGPILLHGLVNATSLSLSALQPA